jgi:hypothetical protein
MSRTRSDPQPTRTAHSSGSVIGIEQAEFARVIYDAFEIAEVGWLDGDDRDVRVRDGRRNLAHRRGSELMSPVFTGRRHAPPVPRRSADQGNWSTAPHCSQTLIGVVLRPTLQHKAPDCCCHDDRI